MTVHRQPARRLTVLVGEHDTYGRRPPATEIAHSAGLAGAGVFRGTEGLGASHAIPTSRIP